MDQRPAQPVERPQPPAADAPPGCSVVFRVASQVQAIAAREDGQLLALEPVGQGLLTDGVGPESRGQERVGAALRHATTRAWGNGEALAPDPA